MTVVEILEQTKALLSNPDHWVKGHYATDLMGRRIGPRSPEAVSWCVRGGLAAVVGTDTDMGGISTASRLLERAAETLYRRDVVGVNDHCGHTAVMRILDLAIDLAKGFDAVRVPAVEEVEAPEPKVLIGV